LFAASGEVLRYAAMMAGIKPWCRPKGRLFYARKNIFRRRVAMSKYLLTFVVY